MLRRFFLAFLFIALSTGCSDHWFASGDRCATVVAVGDILLDRGVKKTAFIEADPYYPFRNVAKIVSGADIVLGNLEGALTERDTPYSKIFLFKADPSYARHLRTAGFNVLTLANNHSYDYGREALLETAEYLKKQGITVIGAGETLEKASQPAFINVRGVRVAIVGFVTLILEGIIWAPDKPSPATAVEELVKESLRHARENADIVIVTVHWGTEFSSVANADQLRWATFFRENGADIVFGHHPHIIQPIEEMNGKWVFYSLGNFIFDHDREDARLAVAARVTTCQKGVRDIRLIPIEILNTRPGLAGESARQEIQDSLKKYSDNLEFHSEGRAIRVKVRGPEL